MIAPIAVFAIGNRSRGDDAVGPLLLDRLRAWLDAEGLAAEFDLFEEYQLQPENALDLDHRRLALFIDACQDADAPATLGRVVATARLAGHSSHALAPGAVLGVYRQITGMEPPPAYVLGLRAVDFELGAPVSSVAHEAMEEGWKWLRALCRCPRAEEWQTMAASAGVPLAQPA